MAEPTSSKNSPDLDPSWDELKPLVARALTESIDYYQLGSTGEAHGFEKANWPTSPLPLNESSLDIIFEQLKTSLFENPQFLNLHPGFSGWSLGGGNSLNLLSQIFSTSVNTSVQTPAQTFTQIESELGLWMKQLAGWPEDSFAIMQSGASTGNLLALLAARHTKWPQTKTSGHSGQVLVLGSPLAHLSILKSLQIMGLGTESFVPVDLNAELSLDPDKLAMTLSQNEKSCLAVVATLGTTQFGSFDQIQKISAVCRRYNVWLHVDAAWGIWTRTSQKLSHLSAGLEAADSVSFDFHKWPGALIGSAMLLVKNSDLLKSFFRVENAYLQSISDPSESMLADYGLETSRPERALSPWLIMKALGTAKIGHALEKNFDLANYFSEKLKEIPGAELAHKCFSNSVAVRFCQPSEDSEKTDRRSRTLAEKLWREGHFMPSLLKWNKCLYLRFCFMNHRTEQQHVDQLLKTLRTLCQNS